MLVTTPGRGHGLMVSNFGAVNTFKGVVQLLIPLLQRCMIVRAVMRGGLTLGQTLNKHGAARIFNVAVPQRSLLIVELVTTIGTHFGLLQNKNGVALITIEDVQP